MTDHSKSPAANTVAIHLLDSAQGNSLQTWRFTDKHTITIGRSSDNDIAISDPHVSRLHVTLVERDGSWTLTSTGRHGTLIHDHLVSEAPLTHQAVFRLGASGPMLRFDDKLEVRHSETLDGIDFDVFAALEIDESRKQQEVEQITENSLFHDLREHSRRLKAAKDEDPKSK